MTVATIVFNISAATMLAVEDQMIAQGILIAERNVLFEVFFGGGRRLVLQMEAPYDARPIGTIVRS